MFSTIFTMFSLPYFFPITTGSSKSDFWRGFEKKTGKSRNSCTVGGGGVGAKGLGMVTNETNWRLEPRPNAQRLPCLSHLLHWACGNLLHLPRAVSQPLLRPLVPSWWAFLDEALVSTTNFFFQVGDALSIHIHKHIYILSCTCNRGKERIFVLLFPTRNW